MNDVFLKEYINSGKPEGLVQPLRFFALLICLLSLVSCASSNKMKKSEGIAMPGKSFAFPKGIEKISRDSADGIFMDAVKAKMLDNKEEAFRKYLLFAAARPANATAHYELSRLWFERNNVPRALTEIRTAMQYDSVNKWILKQYADLLSFEGQYVEAAAVYEKMAGRERSPEEYLFREAALYQKAGKFREALSVMDKLAQYIGADDEALIMQRQQLYLNMNDVESAANEMRKLIRYYPQEPRYALMLGELYENNGLADKADVAYQDAEARFPEDATLQFAMVQYYLKKKDAAKVEHYLSQAILNRTVSMEDRIALLVPFIQYRGADSASRHMAFDLSRRLAEQKPPQPEAIALYGDLLVADGNIDSALAEYKKVLTLDSLHFNSWQQVLYLFASRADFDSLTRYSERAIRLFPKESMAYYFGGIGYMQQRNNTKAIALLNKAVQYQPAGNDNLLSEILVSLGDVYNTEKRFRSSDSCYKAALELQPNNATALNNYSYYLSERGEHLDEAERMSAQSLRLRPDEATFMDTYGWILYKQGKYKEAKIYILKAIESNKNDADPTLWEHLGDIEYRLGNKEDALTHWKTAYSKGEISDSLQQKINEKKLHD